MRKWINRASVLAVLAITACNHATDLYNVDRATYISADALSNERAEDAIKSAGSRLGWEMKSVEPGLIRGTLHNRKHLAVVDINYDGRGYSIGYVDSDNLSYDEQGGVIHKSYNKWIQNLERQIRIESGNV